MNPKQLLIDTYRQQGALVEAHFSDFTEAEMLIRPADSANHAAWQLGHLITSTANLVNMGSPGAFPAPSPDETKRYSREGCRLNEGFAGKDELLRRFADTNEHAIKWIEGLSDAEMDKPMPEALQAFAPTLGHLAYVLPSHVMMHLGQIQVIRRKLGKPVLF